MLTVPASLEEPGRPHHGGLLSNVMVSSRPRRTTRIHLLGQVHHQGCKPVPHGWDPAVMQGGLCALVPPELGLNHCSREAWPPRPAVDPSHPLPICTPSLPRSCWK